MRTGDGVGLEEQSGVSRLVSYVLCERRVKAVLISRTQLRCGRKYQIGYVMQIPFAMDALACTSLRTVRTLKHLSVHQRCRANKGL